MLKGKGKGVLFIGLLSLCVAALFLACAQKAKKIEVEPASQDLVGNASTAQFTAKGLDDAGNPIEGLAFAWKSADPNVATVAEDGTVTAASTGTTEITAGIGEVQGSATVNVLVLKEIKINPPEKEIMAGSEAVFTAVGVADNNEERSTEADNQKFSWTSSDEKVARVVAPMKIKGEAPGEATITVSYAGVTGTAKIKVVQPVPAAVKSSVPAVTLKVGASQKITAGVYDAAGVEIPNLKLTWTSANPKIATVDENGEIKGVAPGKTKIKVAYETFSAEINVDVTK
jgi:uncharacterized protein YjdB